ncbi:MAG: Gp49 family protein [Methylococcaceae bacterium]
MSFDKEIEKEIVEKGLTIPSVTLEQIENTIVSEQYHVFEGTTFTVCLLTLKNGFNVSGESACVSPEKFDAKEGQKYARENAVQKIWALEGYLLKERLSK